MRSNRLDPLQHLSASRGAVLVVEDEAAIGTFVRRVLRNHDVTLVTRAKDALDILSTGKQFDVIVSDVTMPGMSGVDFYDQLVEHHPDVITRVIFLTGGVLTAATQALFDSVPNEVVAKPFHPERFRETVERVSASPRGGTIGNR